ncbi:MAG: hypothetical protein ACRELG_16995, partial [Gemmataceae bacterium]
GMLMDAPNPMVESSLVSTMSDIYGEHFRLAAVHLKNVDEAFEIVEQARGRALADGLRSHRAWAREEFGTVVPAEEQIDELQRQLRQPHTSEERARLLDKLDEAEALLANSQGEDAQIRRLTPARPISLHMFESSLRPNELVLEYVLGKPSSFCLVISPKATALRVLPGGKQIDASIRQYLVDVTANKSAEEPAKKLYTWLLAGCIDPAGKQRLIIVPDGK